MQDAQMLRKHHSARQTWDFGCLVSARRPSRTLIPVASVLGPELDDAAIVQTPRNRGLPVTSTKHIKFGNLKYRSDSIGFWTLSEIPAIDPVKHQSSTPFQMGLPRRRSALAGYNTSTYDWAPSNSVLCISCFFSSGFR